jgi:ATP-dependent DNA helicase RecG
MNKHELERILSKGEGLRVEFKKAQKGIPASLYDTVVSFLNREGGIILLGVDDDGAVLGLREYNIMQFKSDIITSLNNAEIVSPVFPLSVNEAKYENNKILYIRVPVSSTVHKHRNTYFDRENDSDIRVSDHSRIGEMYARKRQEYTENQIYPFLKIEDLDNNIFYKVRNRISLLNSTHPWLECSNERLLRDARLLRRDFTSGNEGLTLASALIFGTDEVIGNILPAYKIDVLVRIENLNRWDDRLQLKTNLIDSYEKVLRYLKSKWSEKFFIENGDRKDLRELIFRELVANVIIHREYNNPAPTEIIIYKDRVEAKNPNRPRFSGMLDLETFEPEPKNPNIRAFFNILSWADEIGSGVKNIYKYLNIYSGSKPTFIEGEKFISLLPLSVELVEERYRIFVGLSIMNQSELSNERIKELKSIQISSELINIEDDDEFAIKLIQSWSEKSKELQSLRFLLNKDLEIEDLKKVKSWSEKSKELLKKRSRVILAALLLSLMPTTLDDMVSILGYKNKDSFRRDYVNILKDNGLINYTIPEKPNDPNQAYVLTQKGMHFIAGSKW